MTADHGNAEQMWDDESERAAHGPHVEPGAGDPVRRIPPGPSAAQRHAARRGADDAGTAWADEVPRDDGDFAARVGLRAQGSGSGLRALGLQGKQKGPLGASRRPFVLCLSPGPLSPGSLSPGPYSTSFSCVSSAAMRSERRKRLSLALISKLRRSTTRARSSCLRLRQRRRSWRAASGRGAAHEADHRLERDLHLEAGRAGTLAAGLDPRIFGDGGGNGVGQLPGQPVHHVIHSGPPHRRRSWGTGASPNPSCTVRQAARTGRQICSYQ